MAKNIILDWCRNVTGSYHGVNINDYSASFADGFAFAAVIHSQNPELLDGDFDSVMNRMSREERLAWAFNTGAKLGIEKYLDPEDISERRPDEKSVLLYMTTVYKFYHGGSGKKNTSVSAGSIDQLIAEAEKKRKRKTDSPSSDSDVKFGSLTRDEKKNADEALVARLKQIGFRGVQEKKKWTPPAATQSSPPPQQTSTERRTSVSASSSPDRRSSVSSSPKPVVVEKPASSVYDRKSSTTDRPAVLQNLWNEKDRVEVSSDSSSFSSSSNSSSSSTSGTQQEEQRVVTPIKVEPGTRRRRRPDAQVHGPTVDNSYVELVPKIYLGDDDVAHKQEKLTALGITHIVCLSESPYYQSEPFPDKFEYKTWQVQDSPNFEIYDLFDPIADWISMYARKYLPKILIYDKNGTSLAPSIAMAYLMRECDMILDEAEKLVQTKWPKTKPNKGFIEQLEDFDMDMDDERADEK
jgi:hypothetical protein